MRGYEFMTDSLLINYNILLLYRHTARPHLVQNAFYRRFAIVLHTRHNIIIIIIAHVRMYIYKSSRLYTNPWRIL